VRTGIGRSLTEAFKGHDLPGVFTPDDLMAGRIPVSGPVVLYDDDNFYLASVLAEVLVAKGLDVHFVSTEDTIAGWTANTLDYRHIQKRLRKLGVHLYTGKTLGGFDGQQVRLDCVWSDDVLMLPATSLVTVSMRLPNDSLHQELLARQGEWAAAGISQVHCIGDALAPGLIVHAVYAGHRFAREFEADAGENGDSDGVPFKRVRHRF
jgi:dimethylamine/trimethylamine dehydrogenase